MFRISSPQDNAISVTYLFLKYIGAQVTETTVEETLSNHPHYPSLLAISDALNEWHIENACLRIKPEQLTEIPLPFLTYLALNGGSFIIVKSIKENIIEWISSDKKVRKENLVDFIKKWSGVILVAEVNENSGEENYQENKRKEFWSVVLTSLFLLALSVTFINTFYQNFSINWHYNALLITKLFGTFISSILLWQSIDKNNPFIKTICQFNTYTNCSSILNSNAAQITPWLNWSEVGFFYFAGGLISLLIFPGSFLLFQILASLSILYTCWSVYYQGFIAKKWCTLCLLVQGIICLEFFISLPNSFSFFLTALDKFSSNNYLIVLQGFLVPVLIWVFLKPILQKNQQTNKLKNELRKFKNNIALFLNQLHTQPEIPFMSKVLDPVIIGNSKTSHTLTIVTNPFCQPCAKAHKAIKELIEVNKEVGCQVIFSASNQAKDPRGVIARGILSMPSNQRAKLLDDWYKNEQQDVDKWLRKHNIIENQIASNTLAQHQIWIEIAGITATPTIYFNGFKMPELYEIKDLNRLLKSTLITDFARS